MQWPGNGHATATGATLCSLATRTDKGDMVKIVAFSPKWAAGLKVGCPHLAHGQGLGGSLGSSRNHCGALCFGCGQGVTLQFSGVFAFINQALQFACLGLRVWNAPCSRASNRQAYVFALVHALEHVGRFTGWR